MNDQECSHKFIDYLEVEEESEDQLDDDSSSQHSDMAMTESDTLQELTTSRTI